MSLQSSILQKFDELRTAFDHREIFSSEVNATRAKTQLIAGEEDRQKRTLATKSQQSEEGATSVARARGLPSLRKQPNKHSSRDGGNNSYDGGRATPATLQGLKVLEKRLNDVEDAANSAQAKGVALDVELRARCQMQEKEGEGAAPSKGNAATKGRTKSVVQIGGKSVPKKSFAGAPHSLLKRATPTHDKKSMDDSTSSRSSSTQLLPTTKVDAIDISARVPVVSSRGNLAPSEWFQKSAEHREYPNVEEDMRKHLRHRDEQRKGGDNMVERYTVPFTAHLSDKEKAWNEQSVKVSIGVIAPDPLEELKKKSAQRHHADDEDDVVARMSKKAAMKTTSSPIQKRQKAPGGQHSAGDEEYFEKMQSDRNTFIKLARHSKKARRVYQDSVARELLAAANMLGPHVPLFSNDPKANDDSFLHRNDDDDASFHSSDSEDNFNDPKELAEREGISTFADTDANYSIPGVRVEVKNDRLEDMTDVCDLMECTIVCLCQCINGTKSSITKEQAILRTILVHALQSGLPYLQEEMHRRDAFVQKLASAPPAQRLAESSLMCRLLRSWSKGVETLLTIDLATVNADGIPFSVHNDTHLTKCVEYYCQLHSAKEERVATLFTKWRSNKEEADSAIINNDSSRIVPPPLGTNEAKSQELLQHFKRLASVSSDDLQRLDHDAATIAYRQQEIAQLFLDRVTRFLPDPCNGVSEEELAEKMKESDLMLHRSPPTLRHVLLQYAGLLRPAARIASQRSDNSSVSVDSSGFEFKSASVSPEGINKFLNVFRSSWGRTPLSGEVDGTERADRSTVVQNGTVIALMDMYFNVLSPLLRDRVKLMVRDEKARTAQLKAKLQSDSEELRKALGAYSTASGRSAKDEEAHRALQEVERHQLIQKYTKPMMDDETLDRLKKSVESSEAWFLYDQSRRAARIAAANHREEPKWDDEESAPAKSSTTSRMEMVRMRKLQELEACWQRLSIGYSLRIALHDKWNHPTKEVKHIDAALKIYRECIIAVDAREASLQAILANEGNEDKAEKMSKRHVLFNQMSLHGQTCELLAKKLFNETGDELHYRNDVYLTKLRDDFAAISQLIRSNA